MYHVAGFRPSLSEDAALASGKPVWDVPLIVAGDAAESDLAPIGREGFEAAAETANLRWIGPGEDISLAGTAIRGQNSWWWLVLSVLGLLLLEMAVLAWPAFRPDQSGPSYTFGSHSKL